MLYETYKRKPPICAPDLTARPVVKVRVPWKYDADAASRDSGFLTCEPTRTQQQFKDEVDINQIAKNFGITGRLPENVRMPTFGDFVDVDDFQSALNASRRAMHSFMQMPAEVRLRFENDPQQFLAFCSNPGNRDEAVKLGLIPAPPVSSKEPAPAPAPAPM